MIRKLRDRLLLFAWVFALAVLAIALLQAQANAQSAMRYETPSPSAESSRVLCTKNCLLGGFQVNTGAVAMFVMLFDAATAPVDGAVVPLKEWQVATNTTLSVAFSNPLAMATGAVVVCSSTGLFTKTASATCQISGERQ